MGGTDGGAGGREHTEVARDRRGQGTANESDGRLGAKTRSGVRHADGDGHDDDEDRKPGVLSLKEGGGTVLDLLGDVLHHCVAIVALHDGEVTHNGEDQGGDSGADCNI